MHGLVRVMTSLKLEKPPSAAPMTRLLEPAAADPVWLMIRTLQWKQALVDLRLMEQARRRLTQTRRRSC